MNLEFTKDDLVMTSKKMESMLQSLCDMAGNAEDCKKSKIQGHLDNAIASLTEAQAEVQRASLITP